MQKAMFWKGTTFQNAYCKIDHVTVSKTNGVICTIAIYATEEFSHDQGNCLYYLDQIIPYDPNMCNDDIANVLAYAYNYLMTTPEWCTSQSI